MPLEILTQIPERTSVRGIPIPEVSEVLVELKKLPKDKAIEVFLSTETVTRFSKKTKSGKDSNPATELANSLKRRFATDGLAYECYVSPSGKTVIVRHERK